MTPKEKILLSLEIYGASRIINMKNPKVSIVIPIFEPEKEVFEKLKEMLKRQTVKAEVVENWNMPEAKSMNTGIKKAKGEIIVILEQDCVPENETWLEKLIAPLENKNIAATGSYLLLSEERWKKYPLLLRLLIIKELKKEYPDMDIRACAYRKKDLIEVGLINEDVKAGADTDLYMKLKKRGEIVNAEVGVFHLHNQKSFRHALMRLYSYSEGNGKMVRKYKSRIYSFWVRILRALPLFGLILIVYGFPFKKYSHLFPAYMATAALSNHLVNVVGFWRGFFSKI